MRASCPSAARITQMQIEEEFNILDGLNTEARTVALILLCPHKEL